MLSQDIRFYECCHLVAQSCPALCSPSDSFIHGIPQARILELVAISFSRGSSQPRGWAWVSCTVGRFFTTEPPEKWIYFINSLVIACLGCLAPSRCYEYCRDTEHIILIWVSPLPNPLPCQLFIFNIFPIELRSLRTRNQPYLSMLKKKNWCFWTMVLEKILESPLDCKEIQPVHPKGDQY